MNFLQIRITVVKTTKNHLVFTILEIIIFLQIIWDLYVFHNFAKYLKCSLYNLQQFKHKTTKNVR